MPHSSKVDKSTQHIHLWGNLKVTWCSWLHFLKCLFSASIFGHKPFAAISTVIFVPWSSTSNNRGADFYHIEWFHFSKCIQLPSVNINWGEADGEGKLGALGWDFSFLLKRSNSINVLLLSFMSFSSSGSDELRDQYLFCVNACLKFPFSHFCALPFLHISSKWEKSLGSDASPSVLSFYQRGQITWSGFWTWAYKISLHSTAPLDLSFEEGIASSSILVRLFNIWIDVQGESQAGFHRGAI